MITLYGAPNTRSVRPVWAAEELGIEYDYVPVALHEGEHRQPEFMALNPAARVPVMVDGDLVLGESPVICTYLADSQAEQTLTPPPGSPERAHHDRWCYFAISELEQPLWTLAKHRFVLPQQYRVEAIQETAEWEFQMATRALASALGKKTFIVGRHFSVADILLTHCLAWAQRAKLELSQENLQAYRDQHLARPALVRAQEREAAHS